MLLVGLGNPGSQYKKNRHNIGFMVLDAIADACGASPWAKKFSGAWVEGRLGAQKLFLLKPQTFMNLSGESVGQAAGFYKVPPAQVIVFHDELDLPAGRLRVKLGGGNGGHNGLKSIDQYLGPDYVRVRIGIGHPGDKDRVTGHVLGDFAPEEIPVQEQMIGTIVRELPALLSGDAAGFMNKVALEFKDSSAI